MGELHDRLSKMRRLISLREQLGRVAEGESAGLAAVKAEGAAIVREHGERLARERAEREAEVPVEPEVEVVPAVEDLPEPPKRKRRRGRRGGRKRPQGSALPAGGSASGGTVVSAAHDTLDPDPPPVTSERPFKLRFEDGSERTPPNDGRVFGPN